MTKHQRKLYRYYQQGTLNIHAAARRLGYTGNRMSKGMRHIRDILNDMDISVVA